MENCCCGVALGDRFLESFPLHWAADRGCLKCVKHLVEIQKCDVCRSDRYGDTPLYDAVSCGHFEVARQLIAYRAEVDVAYQKGNTPVTPLMELSTAECTLNNVNLAKLLIKNGAKSGGIQGFWVKAIFGCRENCKLSVATFIGIRKKTFLMRNTRDTNLIIAKMLWSTQLDEVWGRWCDK